MFTRHLLFVLTIGILGFVVGAATAQDGQPPVYKSPMGVVFSPDGAAAYVTNHSAHTLAVIDVAGRTVVKEIPVGRSPTGVAVTPDGAVVLVANTLSHSISFIDPSQGVVTAEVKCGFEPTGLCLSPDGRTLYSANYISDDVSVIDIAARSEVARIKVGRAPRFLAITPDGKTLVVSNSLSHQPATQEAIAAYVSVIDTASRQVVAQRYSSTGMLMCEGIAVSPDGKYAYSVHLRPNANVAPTQLNQGWVQTNALTVIPLVDPNEKVVTLLLDKVQSGAANPCGVAVSKDGASLLITHRGTHQLSVLNLPKLHETIKTTDPKIMARAHVHLGLLWSKPGVIRRVDCGGLGPGAVAVSPADGTVFVTNYFSDAVAILDPTASQVIGQIALGPAQPMTAERKGEFLFHDALHCFQHWLSCASCHPQVRADGLNWDLLNDGMTNPKNAKSLVGSSETPPSMWRGVRPRMEVAVEKGFLFIEFHTPTQEEIDAVSAYLRSLPFIPSPWHCNADGTPDEQAQRGKEVFKKAQCNLCHRRPHYTNLEKYDVGTLGERDFAQRETFDTPSLLEIYRTAPYLHDGRAATLHEVLITFNEDDLHGETSQLTPQEIQDLIAFLMTL